MGTVSLAGAAADTFFCFHKWAGSVVHLHLAGAGAAAHTDIFEGAAEAGAFMSFKMG